MANAKYVLKNIGLVSLFFVTSFLLSKNIKNLSPIKYIIWDAGSTLTTINQWGIIQKMGAKNIIQMVWYLGGPRKVRLYMKEALEQYAGIQKAPSKGDTLTNDDYGNPLPHLMSDTWLCSRISNTELINRIDRAVDLWKPSEEFSYTQKKLIKVILKTALSAHILGNNTYCRRKTVSIVKKLNEGGYKQYVLSNFDKEAFEVTYNKEENREVFGYIPREHIVISGDCGMIKPHRCIFTYFLEKYQLNPEECLFIDDQLENIKTAQACGMFTIHFKNSSYHKLERILKKLGLL